MLVQVKREEQHPRRNDRSSAHSFQQLTTGDQFVIHDL